MCVAGKSGVECYLRSSSFRIPPHRNAGMIDPLLENKCVRRLAEGCFEQPRKMKWTQAHEARHPLDAQIVRELHFYQVEDASPLTRIEATLPTALSCSPAVVIREQQGEQRLTQAFHVQHAIWLRGGGFSPQQFHECAQALIRSLHAGLERQAASVVMKPARHDAGGHFDVEVLAPAEN